MFNSIGIDAFNWSFGWSAWGFTLVLIVLNDFAFGLVRIFLYESETGTYGSVNVKLYIRERELSSNKY